MKPPPFSYHDPRTLSEAVGLLATLENAKLLAGGQSLMPMLNMRFVLPDHVIDLNKIDGLSFIREANGKLEIGAMTRQRDIEFSDVVARACPLLREAILNVGHRQTRNRGTIGGSLCHLDPSAELVVASAALDARITVTGKDGERVVDFAEFPMGYMTPSIGLDEMVTRIDLPLWPAGHGYGFVEFARRHGDFAIVSVAALLDADASGKIRRASITVGGASAAPLRMPAVEQALVGQTAGDTAFRAAAEQCRTIDAVGDVHATPAYRQHLAVVLTRRALSLAHSRIAAQ